MNRPRTEDLTHEADARRVRRVRVVLWALLAPLGAFLLAAMILLWPGSDAPGPLSQSPAQGQTGSTTEGAVTATGTVVRVDRGAVCPEDEGSTVRSSARCDVPYVNSPSGGGLLGLTVPPEIAAAHPPAVGDRVQFMQVSSGDSLPSGMMVDFDRSVPLWILSLAYLAVVVLVARWRGLRAVVGLVLAFAVLALFVFPALAAGEPAVPVGLVGCAVIMFAVLYFAHGVSARTSTALIGTLAGLGLTAGIATWAAHAAGLVGLGDEATYTVHAQLPAVDLTGLVTCGMLVAGLGVLNDVTVTQASAVWELAAADPSAGARRLFSSAMRIGRDHIASTVYTIAFAYAGSAFTTLFVLSLYDSSLGQLLSTSSLAAEVVRTLVGSIGLVVAIPLTTAVAVAVVRASGPRTGKPPIGEPGPGAGGGRGRRRQEPDRATMEP